MNSVQVRIDFDTKLKLMRNAGVLCRLAREADKWNANRALNDIGTALYELRRHITALQEAHHKAEHQQREPQE